MQGLYISMNFCTVRILKKKCCNIPVFKFSPGISSRAGQLTACFLPNPYITGGGHALILQSSPYLTMVMRTGSKNKNLQLPKYNVEHLLVYLWLQGHLHLHCFLIIDLYFFRIKKNPFADKILLLCILNAAMHAQTDL